MDSKDVNEYLHTIAGESMSAKDFRTWGGTTIAGTTLFNLGKPRSEEEAKTFIAQAYEEVAENLAEIEDEGEAYDRIEDLWPDYPTKEDFFFNEDEY